MRPTVSSQNSGNTVLEPQSPNTVFATQQATLCLRQRQICVIAPLPLIPLLAAAIWPPTPTSLRKCEIDAPSIASQQIKVSALSTMPVREQGMTTETNRIFVAIVSPLVFAALTYSAAAETWQAVHAILEERCVACHSGEYAPLGLVLDSYQSLMSGSENGPVVNTEAPAQSPLVQRLTGAAEPRMPLDGPPFLSDAEIATVTAWIEAGAIGTETEYLEPLEPANPYTDGQVTYDEVAGVFGRHCVICHSDNGRYASPPEGLRLSSLEDILRGGERLAVLPGNAQASEIIRRVEGLSDPRMPLDGPPWLNDEDIQLLRDWIGGGAKSADGTPAAIPVGARVRMRGILTGRNEIDGAAFVVTGGTRIDDAPSVGGRAEMRGHIGANGDIIADRLRDR